MLPQLISTDDRVQIGCGTYATSPPVFRPHHLGNRILVGKFCSFGQDVAVFAGGDHPLNAITTHPIGLWFDLSGMEEWGVDCTDGNEVTRIENDVWLGHQSLILSGSVIGNGAVVGARAVVKGVVPPYSVVAGNPARVLRYRFSEEGIRQLELLRWWNWPEERIRNAAPLLRGCDISALTEYALAHGS